MKKEKTKKSNSIGQHPGSNTPFFDSAVITTVNTSFGWSISKRSESMRWNKKRYLIWLTVSGPAGKDLKVSYWGSKIIRLLQIDPKVCPKKCR